MLKEEMIKSMKRKINDIPGFVQANYIFVLLKW